MFRLHPQLSADTSIVGDLPLSRVLLSNDTQFPWLILVPRRNNIQEIYQLTAPDRILLELESSTVGRLLMTHYQGDKLNIAALGNQVPQLHIHHIVRFRTDPAWPKPVWGALPPKPYTEAGLTSTLTSLRALIASELTLLKC